MSLKILCLHGFRHNSVALRRSMEPTLRKLAKYEEGVEFDYCDSPFPFVDLGGPAQSPAQSPGQESEYRQWWSATRENVLTLADYDTVDQSLQHVLSKWDSGRYDGLLGFSQGSILAQIFAYRIQDGTFATYAPRFVILASTFPISDTRYRDLYRSPLTYPTAVMTGSRDTLVDMKESLSVVTHLSDPYVIVHTGGHYFSTSSEAYYRLREFLKRFLGADSGADAGTGDGADAGTGNETGDGAHKTKSDSGPSS